MNTFEVILPGFDGSTDETDHLIKWILADSAEKVKLRYPDARIYLIYVSHEANNGAIDEILI